MKKLLLAVYAALLGILPFSAGARIADGGDLCGGTSDHTSCNVPHGIHSRRIIECSVSFVYEARLSVPEQVNSDVNDPVNQMEQD